MKSICNYGYARSRRGSGHFPDVRGLLKYIQYRDTRDDHIAVAGGPDRWVDGGLGSCYQHILVRLDDLSGGNRHAYCHPNRKPIDPSQIEAGLRRRKKRLHA